jgi:hypothetical protein
MCWSASLPAEAAPIDTRRPMRSSDEVRAARDSQMSLGESRSDDQRRRIRSGCLSDVMARKASRKIAVFGAFRGLPGYGTRRARGVRGPGARAGRGGAAGRRGRVGRWRRWRSVVSGRPQGVAFSAAADAVGGCRRTSAAPVRRLAGAVREALPGAPLYWLSTGIAGAGGALRSLGSRVRWFSRSKVGTTRRRPLGVDARPRFATAPGSAGAAREGTGHRAGSCWPGSGVRLVATEPSPQQVPSRSIASGTAPR